MTTEIGQSTSRIPRGPASPLETSVAPRRTSPLLTRRTLCYALGLLWLLDGALQLQSFMFTSGFARQIIAPAATDQPLFVSGPVHWSARLIGAHPMLLDGLFASVQLAIGLGFLFKRTTRGAIVSSVVWASGIWYFGEGLGGVAGGHTTSLVGAPGAALIYVVLALAAWPRTGSAEGQIDRPDTTRPAHWTLWAWSVLWFGFAALDLPASNSSSSAVTGQLNDAAASVSPWLARVDHLAASAVHGLGSGSTAFFVGAELLIGVVALTSGVWRSIALWSGIALSGVFWVVGQSFGLLLSGQATDPSTAPLIMLLGLTALGATRASRASPVTGTSPEMTTGMSPSVQTTSSTAPSVVTAGGLGIG